MRGIDSLVPGFRQALEENPDMLTAWESLEATASAHAITGRDRALAALTVSQYAGCDYARWVLERLAARSGATGEDILFAAIGATPLGSHVRGILRGGHAPKAYEDVVNHALLACRILRTLEPAAAPAARKGA